MKFHLSETTMLSVKQAMDQLNISDTHDNRIKFVAHCVEVGVANSLFARMCEMDLKAKIPPVFEGYTSTQQTRTPSQCPQCGMAVVQGQDSKYRCNCKIWN